MNGTGPFRLESADEDDGVAVLARHEGYWRAPAGLERVVYRAVSNGSLRLLMLELGDADSSYLESALHRFVSGLPGVKVADAVPQRSVGEVFFLSSRTAPGQSEFVGSGRLDGLGVPPDFFADPHVREGFALAFPYAEFLKKGLGGRGARVAGPFPPSLAPALEGSVPQHSPPLADDAFRQAFGGRLWETGFTVSITYSADNMTRQVAAELMKEEVERLNPAFKVKLHPLPSARFYEALEAGVLPIYVAGYYSDYPDPASFAYGLVHSTGYYPEFQGLASPELDSLSDRLAQAQDPAERDALERKIQEAVARDLPQIYTYAPAPFEAYGPGVSGWGSKDNVANLRYNGFPYFYALSKTAGP